MNKEQQKRETERKEKNTDFISRGFIVGFLSTGLFFTQFPVQIPPACTAITFSYQPTRDN